MAEKEKKGNSNWKKWTAIAAVGLASMFGGNTQDAHAAQQQVGNDGNKVKVSAQVMPDQQYQNVNQKFAALQLELTQLARQKMVFQRTGNTERVNAINQRIEEINAQKVALSQQMQQEQVQQQEQMQQQPQEKVQESVKDARSEFAESIKVEKPMSDEEFYRIAKEAKETGQKITDQKWIAKYQQLRQKAIRDRQQQNMNREAPGQERE